MFNSVKKIPTLALQVVLYTILMLICVLLVSRLTDITLRNRIEYLGIYIIYK